MSGGPGAGARARDPGWDDWRWQLRHRIRGPGGLPAAAAAAGRAPRAVADRFPVAVTPYYASLVRRADDTDPVYRLCMPSARELEHDPDARPDPFGERAAMPVPGLIRRYADRAVLLATASCAVYCRHCTRKHTVGGRRVAAGGAAALRRAADYLRRTPAIREVLVSGGDPLVLDTPRLDRILGALRGVPSIELLRVGTRVPVVLPQRVTRELTRMLRRHHPVWLNTHFNHPAELTPEAAAACAALVDAGIPVGNQTVLLRGVNDDADTLETLFRGLLRMRVRPYYLLHCDPVEGVGHFRVPRARGRALLRALRERMTGLGVPAYVQDVPGAASKRPL